MPSRKVLLLGIAAAAGLYAVLDHSLLSKASAGVADLGGMVAEVKKAQAIAASLESGNPNALQGLLDTLASEEGVTPGEASPGLFGFSALVAPGSPGDGISASTYSAPGSASQPVHRVTMVITQPTGGLAMIDGEAMRSGETLNGLTLMTVHADGVTVREGGVDRFLPLR